MADSSADICGGCCLFIFASCNAWCNTQTFGANGCGNSNTTAGCCGSCCDKSFNEDKFDQQVREDMEKTRDPNVPTITNLNNGQLLPTLDMSVQSAANDANPTAPTT